MPIRSSLTTRPLSSAVAALALALTAGGCGILDVDEPGDTAVVTISGTSPVPLRLIMSNNFIQVLDPQTNEIGVSMLGADTVELNDLPYTENYGLDGNLRFFLRLINPDSMTASLRVQIRIDGVNPYDITTNLTASQHEYTYAAF